MAESAEESRETDAISDKRLAFAALALSLLGLLVLFFYAQSLQPRQTSIGSLTGEKEGAYVQIFGTISSASSRGGSVFIRLCDFSDCIAVFVPGQQADELRINPYLLKPGDKLVVKGVLKDYEGAPEIVPLGPDGLELT